MGVLLSKQYKNNKQNLNVQCKVCLNIWHPRFNDIISRNKWCPFCQKYKAGRKFAHNIKYIKSFISNLGGILLSTEYKNNYTKLKIQCQNGHIFNKTFDHLKTGQWCKLCKKTSKTQKLLANLLENIFSYYNFTFIHDFTGFSWLNEETKRKQEIDIWIPELKLAIEYDGEQHFKPIIQFGGIESLKRVKKLDKIKNKKIKKHSKDIKYFIRFNYKEKKKLNEGYIIYRLLKKYPNIFNDLGGLINETVKV